MKQKTIYGQFVQVNVSTQAIKHSRNKTQQNKVRKKIFKRIPLICKHNKYREREREITSQSNELGIDELQYVACMLFTDAHNNHFD